MNAGTAPRCIFCEIAADRLPASIVHRDADWLVAMDIHPIRAGHALIVPARHVARLGELEPGARHRLFALADAVLHAQEAEGLAAGGGNLLLNDGIAANQHIPHLHLHCIPRRRGDTVAFGLRLLARTAGLFGRPAERDRLDATARALGARIARDVVARTDPLP